MKHYCTECRTYHSERDEDGIGLCYTAEGWREQHQEEVFAENRRDFAWMDFASELPDTNRRMIFKVVHECGCMVRQYHPHVFAYCEACRGRLAEDRYNGGLL